MNFTMPTTKAEMYSVLNDMFNFYRVQREGYTAMNLNSLSLQRLQFSSLTDLQLRTKAENILLADKKRETVKTQEDLTERIAEIDKKIALKTANALTQVSSVTSMYSESEDKVELEATKKGLMNSNIVINKLAELESEKNAKIVEINDKRDSEISDLTAEKTALQSRLSGLSSYIQEVYSAETDKKFYELKEKQEQLQREVFKYNNGLAEKEQRYVNSLTQSNAELQMKYLGISYGNAYTKDQLIEMGYYEDVIACVCGYYDSLTPATAYTDIIHENKLMIYLEDYYEDVVYLYKTVAGA